MTASLPRLLLTAAVSAGLLFGLAACGKKGAPKPPAGEESQYQYPHHYPAPETVVHHGSAPSEDAADPLSIFDRAKRRRTTTSCCEPDEKSVDRKSVVEGKVVSGRGVLGGGGI